MNVCMFYLFSLLSVTIFLQIFVPQCPEKKKLLPANLLMPGVILIPLRNCNKVGHDKIRKYKEQKYKKGKILKIHWWSLKLPATQNQPYCPPWLNSIQYYVVSFWVTQHCSALLKSTQVFQQWLVLHRQNYSFKDERHT